MSNSSQKSEVTPEQLRKQLHTDAEITAQKLSHAVVLGDLILSSDWVYVRSFTRDHILHYQIFRGPGVKKNVWEEGVFCEIIVQVLDSVWSFDTHDLDYISEAIKPEADPSDPNLAEHNLGSYLVRIFAFDQKPVPPTAERIERFAVELDRRLQSLK